MSANYCNRNVTAGLELYYSFKCGKRENLKELLKQIKLKAWLFLVSSCGAKLQIDQMSDTEKKGSSKSTFEQKFWICTLYAKLYSPF